MSLETSVANGIKCPRQKLRGTTILSQITSPKCKENRPTAEEQFIQLTELTKTAKTKDRKLCKFSRRRDTSSPSGFLIFRTNIYVLKWNRSSYEMTPSLAIDEKMWCAKAQKSSSNCSHSASHRGLLSAVG